MLQTVYRTTANKIAQSEFNQVIRAARVESAIWEIMHTCRKFLATALTNQNLG